MALDPDMDLAPHGQGVVVRIVSHLLDTEFGVWCDDCLMPSAYTAVIAMETLGGKQIGVYTVTFCPDCGGHS